MKIKKLITAVLFVSMCAGMLGGCKKAAGTPEDNAVKETSGDTTKEVATYKYGFSVISMENPYYATLESAVREEVAKDGSTMITKDPGNNSDTQIQQIDEMIEEGINFLFLSPVDWEKISPELEKLKQEDIKVVNIDTQVKDMDSVSAFVGSDNKNAGVVCAQDLIERFPEGGKVAIIEQPTVNSINDRITGFEETLASADKGFEVVTRADAKGDGAEAKMQAAQILAQNPEITAIMCGNDIMAAGVLEAIKASGNTNVLLYSIDGSPNMKKELSEQNSQVAGLVGQSPINMGKAASKVAKKILEGQSYEAETLVETFFITKDNLDMYGVDGWQ